MFDTKESAVVETAIDDEEMKGIESSVLGVLEDRKEQAITVEEMRKVLQGAFTRKQLYSALHRLELRDLTFRFLVDDKEYVALVAYRTTAYVITPFALSPKIELLYWASASRRRPPSSARPSSSCWPTTRSARTAATSSGPSWLSGGSRRPSPTRSGARKPTCNRCAPRC
jgi:hypothetical protein